MPTEEEVKEHYLRCHMPYRSWCHHCIRGRGKEREHGRRAEEEQQGIPEYHLDYCFPRDEFDHRLIVLVAVEKHTKMKRVTVVPNKGSAGTQARNMVLELMEECGDKERDVVLKTDQEPATRALAGEICASRTGARTIPAPKGSKGSNGVVERAVQSAEQCLRPAKSSLDERMGVKIKVLRPILTWLCDFIGFMMNRREVASDGKAPYERVKGKRIEVIGLEFGEKVLWKHHSGKRLDKISARWSAGIFLGRADHSRLGDQGGEVHSDGEVGSDRAPMVVGESVLGRGVPWNRGKHDA